MTALTTLKDITFLIAKAAPLLATALGTPVSGMVLQLIANKFNIPAGDLQALSERLTSQPDASNNDLIELENQHGEALASLQNNAYQIEIQDRANARASINHNDWVPHFLACSFLAVYVVVQLYVILHPTANDDVISARVQDILVMIISFYFGSSVKQEVKQVLK